jgi:hypothetical protein
VLQRDATKRKTEESTEIAGTKETLQQKKRQPDNTDQHHAPCDNYPCTMCTPVTSSRHIAPTHTSTKTQSAPVAVCYKETQDESMHTDSQQQQKKIGAHALPRTGFGLSTPRGAERGGQATPCNTGRRWQRGSTSTIQPTTGDVYFCVVAYSG